MNLKKGRYRPPYYQKYRKDEEMLITEGSKVDISKIGVKIL